MPLNDTRPADHDERAHVAWLDVETTSLDGAHPAVLLLEVALVVTDADLQELGRECIVVRHTPQQVEAAKWDPIAREMHEANGLLEEVGGPTAVPLEEAQGRLLRTLCRYTGVDLTSPPGFPGSGAEAVSAPLWGGCSPSLDRAILRRLMPVFYSRVHYRSIDATSLKLAARLWAGVTTERAIRPHRALPDALSAIKLAAVSRRVYLAAARTDVLSYART